MPPFTAICRDCQTKLEGETVQEIGDLMIKHSKGKITKEWENACNFFRIERTDTQGEKIAAAWVETVGDLVVTPWTRETLYNGRKRKKESL